MGYELYHYDRQSKKECDFKKEIVSCDIDEEKVSKVEELYGIEAPDMLKRMITMCTDDTKNMVANNRVNLIRILSFDELMHPEKRFGAEFKSQGFVAVADCLNNDSLGYDVNMEKWVWRSNEGQRNVYMKDKDVISIICCIDE